VINYVSGVLQLIDSTNYNYEIKRAIPSPHGTKGNWYDDFVRLPDYIAGVVAAWDIDGNFLGNDKREKLFMENIVDSNNVVIFRVIYDGMLHIEHVSAARRRTTTN
jgi:hypothetical protein